MSLRDTINSFIGGKNDSNASSCPREPEILSYLEDRLSSGERQQMESHFIDCFDCREFLAIFSRVSAEQIESPVELLSDEEVRAQTAFVLDKIKEDESKQQPPSPLPTGTSRSGLYVSYWQLAAAAAVVIVLASVCIYWITREPSPDQFAMQSLALSLRDERKVEPRISGGFGWSDYKPTRGAEDDNRLTINNAINRMKSAESSSAPQEARITLARLYLASGDRQKANLALEILSQIASTGKATAESLNDLGVARFVLGQFDQAADAFAQALEKSPGYEEALFNRALANYRAGHTEEARRDWQEFIKKSKDEKWKTEAQQHLDSIYPSTVR